MIKVYGLIMCSDSRSVIISFDKAGVDYEFQDICTNLLNLKEFLNIHDTNYVFDKIKADKGIGMLCIVLEDGTVNPKFR